MRRVTSKDVAKAAGVSQTTVSFVLNGKHLESISEATRRLVLATADELGYIPSAAARSLRTGRSDVVLCLIPDWPVTDAMSRLKLALSDRLADAGVACVYFYYKGQVQTLSALWRNLQPSLVIAFGAIDETEAHAMRGAGIPFLNGLFDIPGGPSSPQYISQESIGRTQIEHLAERGHRHIAYAGIGDDREDVFALPRIRGAEQACRDLGLPRPDVVAIEPDRAAAGRALDRWRGMPKPVTAVAAFNDVIAAAVLAAAWDRGVDVPGGLAVIGVDDLALARLTSPPLTTVTIDLDTAARHLCDHALTVMGIAEARPAPDSGTALRIVRRASS
ncbi:LacI family DNA-binding transcriptional regulator [Streptomyces sp. NPDC090106]|uniref:LacI family DNA-binding transcriptional regulator n=1 Tax=Streptomyces sp. NPDC090106 TaxID=3365946 RepID=UPI0037F8D925